LKTRFGFILIFFISLAIHAASSIDLTFDPGTGANGVVEQALPLADGKILICGNFTQFNGKDHAYIARLNSNGSVDETFNGHPSYWVRHMSLQSDGKIVIAGYFSAVSDVPRNLIARLNADGSLDTTFNPGTGATDIIAGGVDGNNTPFIFWTALQSDGKIIATGNFLHYNGQSSVGLVRINPDGSIDPSFNVGAGLNSWGRHILVQPNGQIMVSGWFTTYNNQGYNRLVRINPNGSADTSFNPYFGDRTAIYCTALVDGGKVIASGHSLNYDGLFKRELERLNPDGSVDSSFVGTANDMCQSSLVQPDGKIIIGGNFSVVDGTQRRSLARMNPDGTLDDSLQANVDNYIWCAVLQADGKLLVSGGFYTIDGFSRNGIARLNTGVVNGPPPPPTPSLSATATSSTAISLNWSDAGTDRTGYTIELKTGAANYAAAGNAGPTVRSFTINNLTPNTVYYARLKAATASGGSVYSNEAVAKTQPSSGGTATAAFVGSDTTTGGNWKNAYGAEGYNVIGDAGNYPSYVTVTPNGKSDWTWDWSTTDARCLQRVTASDRLAACWYSGAGFSIDFTITDGQSHRVALYLLDWDNAGRNETVQLLDGDTGALLNTQTVSGFGSGIYLIWNISGHLTVQLAPNSGNAVLSGFFFGNATQVQQTVATPVISPNGGSFTSAQSITLSDSTSGAEIRYTTDGSNPTSTSTLYAAPFALSSSATVKAIGLKSGMQSSGTASAVFTISSGGGGGSGGGSGSKFVYVGTDSATQGNWSPTYGADGYDIMGDATKNPAYVQPVATGKQDWTWNQPTSDVRGLKTAAGSSRLGACWYGNSFSVNFNFTDGGTHRLAIYCCDWDYAGRVETIDLIDTASGSVLQSTSLSNFGGGQYLIWDLKGNVTLRFTKVSGPNAVINGLFLQPAGQQL
jgi:uncharacterized delta-60 repeat protein